MKKLLIIIMVMITSVLAKEAIITIKENVINEGKNIVQKKLNF